MATFFKKISESPRTFNAFKTMLEEKKRITGTANNVFANNGTTSQDTNGKNFPIKVEGPSCISANTDAVYTLTDYKVNNQKTLNFDKTQMKWCFYIDGVKLEEPKKHVRLMGKKSVDETTKDFLAIENIKERTAAIEKHAILSWNIKKTDAQGNGENKITIKWSKWLDGHTLHIEAFRNTPDHKPSKPQVVSTIITAQPEIIKGYWTNEKRQEITNKTVGYKDTVYMCLKTLGMQGKTITTELWEEGITYWWDKNTDHELCMNANVEWKLEGRNSYKKLEIPDKGTQQYEEQRKDITEGEQLELYFAIPSEKNTKGYKTKFAQVLYLTTKELINNAYFAKQIHQETIQDGTVKQEIEEAKPKTHTVVSGDNIYALTKKYNIKDWMQFAKDNGVKAPNYWLTIGDTLNLPEEAVIPQHNQTATQPNPQPKAQQQTLYEPINTASLGSEVHLVVETTNLHGKKVTIEVFDKAKLFADDDKTPIKLIKDNTEVTKLENVTIDDTGKATIKVKLHPKSDEDYKTLKEKFKDNKVAKLFLKITCKGNDKYHQKAFLNGSEFEVKLGTDNCKIDEGHFFTEYDKEFTSEKLSEANKTSLKKMFSAINEYYGNEKRCCNLKHIAYMLATAKHETAHTYNPIKERGGNKYLQGLYDPVLGKDENRRKLAKKYGNTTEGDGVKYCGRGFVQLTWKSNYQKMKDKFNVDLINSPEKAMEHELAIKIMIYGSEKGVFSGVNLSKYINDKKTDYYNARRVINITDKASIIEGYAKKIEKCLKIEECNC